jgi:DNA invertase Pin-like site-specific DNA recombinase
MKGETKYQFSFDRLFLNKSERPCHSWALPHRCTCNIQPFKGLGCSKAQERKRVGIGEVHSLCQEGRLSVTRFNRMSRAKCNWIRLFSYILLNFQIEE